MLFRLILCGPLMSVYCREVLAENLTDPAHLPYAHSGVLNSRWAPLSGRQLCQAHSPDHT
jgi:phenylpropionate dioxygenase-like ring-hydroxylating dioxygenase large terminal subunit